ncbi:MAG TPA: hypothetical protein VFC63_01120 [Blastocatellia bacterium]|nr:hypothetical protein [Blastocatellia bacterium]
MSNIPSPLTAEGKRFFRVGVDTLYKTIWIAISGGVTAIVVMFWAAISNHPYLLVSGITASTIFMFIFVVGYFMEHKERRRVESATPDASISSSACPVSSAQSDQIFYVNDTRRPDIDQPRPNVVFQDIETIPVHLDDNNKPVRGAVQGRPECIALIAVFNNLIEGSKNPAVPYNVITRITFMDAKGQRNIKINRGAWLNESNPQVHIFGLNDPHRAIIALITESEVNGRIINSFSYDRYGEQNEYEKMSLPYKSYYVTVEVISEQLGRTLLEKSFIISTEGNGLHAPITFGSVGSINDFLAIIHAAERNQTKAVDEKSLSKQTSDGGLEISDGGDSKRKNNEG